ncbi:MAG: hypothetical protein ACRD4Q_02035 [Candidatus Acidiferrales bacterium]
MRKSRIAGIVLVIVFVLYFAGQSAKTAEVERQQGPAMIALVQQQFEPSHKLMAMHPVGGFTWIATVNAVDCKFQRPKIKNCWEIYFGANVEGPDLNGRKPGKIEANFIVNGDTMQLVGRGPADDIFIRKAAPARTDMPRLKGSDSSQLPDNNAQPATGSRRLASR